MTAAINVGGDEPVRRALELVSELLALEVERMRAAGVPVGEDEYRGLYIADAEADRLVRAGQGAGPNEATAPLEASLDEVRKKLAMTVLDPAGRLGQLAVIAGLSAFDAGCLALCLAAETELGAERLIAYAQDDVSKKRPRVDLALRLLTGAAARGDARAAFHGDSPLRSARLVTLHDEAGQPATPLIARYIALDPRVANYLVGEAGIDEALAGLVQVAPQSPEAPLPDALAARVAALAELPATTLTPPVVALYGVDRTRMTGVAAGVSRASGLGLLTANVNALITELGLEHGFLRAAREAALQRAALLLWGLDELKLEDAERLRRFATKSMAPLLFLVSKELFAWSGVTIGVPSLEHETRLQLWHESLGQTTVEEETLEAVAGKFRLGVSEIQQAAEAARGSARWRDPARPEVTGEDLYAAARAQSTPILNSLAKKVTPHYQWDDIVLAADPLQQLREICGMVEHRHLIYEVWGFERKLAMGKGILSLFAGQSGTGKTMAADIIAGVLGLDMYKIDLSGIVSKYIGETEKNLSTIFAEAETSNAILFFDEADALFGKRSEVKDAHDRYANIETAYLLQRMEEYSGPVILSTNLKMNLDEAFLRRLHFVIDFPMPEEDERRRIWRGTIPAQAPLAEDVDFAFLAKQFKISGGNIRNIVLSAAFLAAADGGEMGMRHLIRATRREYQKLGKMVTEAEFGPYIGLLG